jgi:hypothetical protein
MRVREATQTLTATAASAATDAVEDVFSPEFLLAVACCRWPSNEGRAAVLHAGAARIKDWNGFLQVTINHRIIALVGEALRAAGVILPRSIDDELKSLVQHNVRRGLNLAAETVRIQNMLDAAAIPVVVLKGAAIEQLAYASLASKQTRDIDLLVPPERVAAALQRLKRDGYALSLPAKTLNNTQLQALLRYGREIEIFDPRKRMRVELQWLAADNPWLLKGVGARSCTQTVPLSEGAAVRTLAPDDLFAYLCVHGARHCWSRLKWVADLNALLVSSNTDIEHFYRHAQKIGAGLCAAQALLLCRRLLGLKLPPTLLAELKADKRHRKLVAIAMDALAASNAGMDPECSASCVRYVTSFCWAAAWHFTPHNATWSLSAPLTSSACRCRARCILFIRLCACRCGCGDV